MWYAYNIVSNAVENEDSYIYSNNITTEMKELVSVLRNKHNDQDLYITYYKSSKPSEEEVNKVKQRIRKEITDRVKLLHEINRS